jgi:hypothetical protein
MVAGLLDGEQLFRVQGAPEISRNACAVYPVKSGRRAVIETMLAYFAAPPDRGRGNN